MILIFVCSKEECSVNSEDSFSAEGEYAEYTVSEMLSKHVSHATQRLYMRRLLITLYKK